jgi:hypothetical protein
MFTFSFDIRALKATAIAASNEETRYYLKGVCVEHTPDGPVFVATDGHRLIATRHDWGENEKPEFAPFIIPLDLIKKIKIVKKSGYIGTITINKDKDPEKRTPHVSIEYAGATISGFAIDGIFPDWRRVIPRNEPSSIPSQYQAQYIEEFRDAMIVLAGGKTDAQPRIAHNGNNPAIVDLGDNGRLQSFGVIMPYRIRRDFITVAPEWTNNVQPDPVATATSEDIEAAALKAVADALAD